MERVRTCSAPSLCTVGVPGVSYEVMVRVLFYSSLPVLFVTRLPQRTVLASQALAGTDAV